MDIFLLSDQSLARVASSQLCQSPLLSTTTNHHQPPPTTTTTQSYTQTPQERFGVSVKKIDFKIDTMMTLTTMTMKNETKQTSTI